MQASQFQVLQQMTHVLENNNRLMDRLIVLLENQQTPRAEPAIKSEGKQKEVSPKQKRAKPHYKQAQKFSKQPKKAEPAKLKKKGFFSFLRGK
jgi:hypothetical protein